jgi:hypothetical protein
VSKLKEFIDFTAFPVIAGRKIILQRFLFVGRDAQPLGGRRGVWHQPVLVLTLFEFGGD